MVFFGEYQINFSGSGRLLLPKKVRELLKGNTFILTKGFDVCLAGYDLEDWNKRSKPLLEISLVDNTDIEKRRKIFSGAVEVELDDQGRFVIPKSLSDYIGGESDKLIIIGVGDHFEIWESEKWIDYQNEVNINN